MTDFPIRTSLQRLQGISPMDDAELRSKAAKLWQETGTVMVKPEWFPNDWDRQHAHNIAAKLFGPRKAEA
jgi:hypothetical protein